MNDEAWARVAERFPRNGPWTTESNKLGWSASSTPGGEAIILPGVGRNFTLLQTDEWWMPHTWTLSLWVEVEDPPLDGAAVGFAECAVEFGVGGATQKVDVDFRRGTMLTMPTNSIIVRVTRMSPNSRVYAQVGIGARGACGCPQKQLFNDLAVAPGGPSAVFLLPKFVDDLVITRGTAGDISAPLVFAELSPSLGFTSVIQSVPLSVLTNFYGGKLPVSSGAVALRINNTSLAAVNLSAFARLGL